MRKEQRDSELTKQGHALIARNDAYIASYEEKKLKRSSIQVYTSEQLKKITERRNTIIEPLVHKPGITGFFAGTGVGKTSVVMGMLAGLATNTKVFGKFDVPKAQKCLYVDGDMPADQFIAIKERSLEMTNSPIIKDIRMVSRVAQGQILLEDKFYQDGLLSWAEEFDVIIFDSLNKLTNIDINSAKEFKTIENLLISIRNLGKAVILVHHENKSGTYTGSGTIPESMDSTFIIKRKGTDKSKLNVTISIDKNRYGIPFETLDLQLSEKSDRTFYWRAPLNQAEKATLARGLKAKGLSVKDIRKHLQDIGEKVSDKSIYRWLSE